MVIKYKNADFIYFIFVLAFGKRKTGFEAATTPAKRTRSDSNSTESAKSVSSPWETKRLKGELIEAKGQVT